MRAAQIIDGEVVNVATVPSREFAEARGWILSDNASKGDLWNGTEIVPRAVEDATIEARRAFTSRPEIHIEVDGGEGGARLTDNFLSALDEAQARTHIHLPPKAQLMAGSHTFRVPNGCEIHGMYGDIYRDQPGGSLFRPREDGGSYVLNNMTLHGMNQNAAPLTMWPGGRISGARNCHWRSYRIGAVDAVTAEGGEEVFGLFYQNCGMDAPGDQAGHAFLARSQSRRAYGSWLHVDLLQIHGADRLARPDFPVSHAEGGTGDLISIQGWDRFRLRTIRVYDSGAAGMSIGTRISSDGWASDIYGENCWEGLVNSGSGYFEIITDQAASLREDDLITVGGEVRGRITSLRQVADGVELRISNIPGVAIGRWPRLGEVIVADTQRDGPPVMVRAFRPPASDMTFENVNAIDCAAKREDGDDLGVVNLVGVDGAKVIGAQYSNPTRGRTNCPVSASNSVYEAIFCKPDWYDGSPDYPVHGPEGRGLGHSTGPRRLRDGHGLELTLDGSGWVTPTHRFHRIDMDHALAADDCMGIRTENMQVGDCVTFKLVTQQRKVRFRDSGTQLLMPADIALDHVNDRITFQFTGTENQMELVSHSFNGSNTLLANQVGV